MQLLAIILFLLLSLSFNTSMIVCQSSDISIYQEDLSLQVAGRQGKRRRGDCKDAPKVCQKMDSNFGLISTLNESTSKINFGLQINFNSVVMKKLV